MTTTTRARAPVFMGFVHACAAAGAITHPKSLGDARLLAWVLMPDHLHALLQLGERDPLAQVVGRVKARSAAAVRRLSGNRTDVWFRGYHDRALRCEDDIHAVARYIIANPVRAGLVSSSRDYPFWDAIWVP